MPSPFPGMDPWLERPAVFPGLHNGLIIYLQAALNAVLPSGYVAANDNRVYVDPELRRVPDIGILGPDRTPPGGADATTLAGVGLLLAGAEPVHDPIEETYLEIRTVEDDRLVTAVEVVSPANKKPGEDGRASYKQKQGEYRAAGVNIVEIDLLRGGQHTTAVAEEWLRAVAGRCEYHVSVMVASNPREFYVAPIRLTDRLPVVPFPLEPGTKPVTVDFQAVFDRTYDEGGFVRLAKYATKQPDPPLTPEQQAWAEAVLREKGVLR